MNSILAADTHTSLCILCRNAPPRMGEFCHRCYRDLIDGFHRRREAEQRMPPLSDAA